jgi:hypothetical protein
MTPEIEGEIMCPGDNEQRLVVDEATAAHPANRGRKPNRWLERAVLKSRHGVMSDQFTGVLVIANLPIADLSLRVSAELSQLSLVGRTTVSRAKRE